MASLQEQFEAKLAQVLKTKHDNMVIPTKEKRNQMTQQLMEIDSNGTKTVDDRNLKKRFEIMRVGDEQRLIRKRKVDTEFRFIVCMEEVYEAVSSAHSAVGHGGENKTFKEGQNKWANLTMECCQIYIRFCKECHEK